MLRKVEKTTRLLSRQALPRPARLYSTPTRKVGAPALATVEPVRPEFPSFIVHKRRPAQRPIDEDRILNDLDRFLARDRTYTVLPPPPPLTSSSTDAWFTSTLTQESISIMDACLHNLYDVPRAKIIFEQLRQNDAKSLLETGVYNAFIEAYYGMAVQKDRENSQEWINHIHDLYHVLELELENTVPNKVTYGLMLRAWQYFDRNSTPGHSSNNVNLPSPTKLLEKMHRRNISPVLVVAETVFDSHHDATEAIKTFSQAAVNLNIPEVISELGEAHALAISEDALKDVPEVAPVMRPAKYDDEGNLVSEPEVPFNIAQLRRHLNEVNQTRRILPEDVMARQKHLEASAYDVALERLQQQAETLDSLGIHNPALNTTTLQKWMWEWHVKLRERLKEEIRNIWLKENYLDGRSKKGRAYGPGGSGEALSPFLSLVNAERLSLITIMEIMRLQGSSGLSDGMKTTRALVSVGKAVEMEYIARMAKKPRILKQQDLTALADATGDTTDSKPTDGSLYDMFKYKNLREIRLAVSKEIEGEERSLGWSQATRSKIGGILVDCLMEVAEVERTAKLPDGETVSEMQPAFHHAYEYLRGTKLGVIRLNPVVSDRLAKDPLKDTLHPRHLPMLVKPQPWVSHNVGGYLYSKTSVMRFKDSLEQQLYLREASKHGQIELVYAGLDVLASTPWRINKKVFDIVLRVWNSGERLGKMPPATYDVPEPEQPLGEQLGDMKARNSHLVRLRAYNQAKANCHSDRCSVNYRLEIARALLNDEFYFPHNLDFRGRAYPIPAHLNHIGDDLCRGLLTFAEAKPLGARGLRWLKIHIANLYGYDKANFDDRVKWVDEHLDQIYQAASQLPDDPTTKAWWLGASDPWQFLAASIELRDALESGDPEAYESSLPVHQDGTCNGLQHYAALGGDVQGAKQVNLEASDKPSDVYSYVGAMVEEVIKKDCEKEMKYALMLSGKITRKVVKQTVMTTVYGVTYIGARDQIEKQLRDRKDIPDEECWPAAAYLTHVVLGCIGNLFKGAQDIQTWLNLSARLIAKSIPEARIPELMAEYLESAEARIKRVKTQAKKDNLDRTAKGTSAAVRVAAAAKAQLPMNRLKKEQMTSVIWTTPLGLPIVQPYRKIARKQIDTAIQSIFISDPNRVAEVNSSKQASAFPPNYIHSLDATHMMLTALECRKKRLTFASVHDSYWTHAADIDEMSSTIRETFIALHSSDVLSQLRSEFLKRYEKYKVPLIHLSGTSLSTKLYNAGSRIYATPEQSKSLTSLKDLVVVSEDVTSTIDESRAPKDEKTVKQLLDELEAKAEAVTKKKRAPGEDAEDEEEEDAAANESPQKKSAKDRKSQQKDAVVKLMGKFVNMTDLLPPLPQKGEFDVETIKSSQYFFS